MTDVSLPLMGGTPDFDFARDVDSFIRKEWPGLGYGGQPLDRSKSGDLESSTSFGNAAESSINRDSHLGKI